MAESTIAGLEEFCRAIQEDDPSDLAARRQAFVSQNWNMVTILDRLAHADHAAGQFEAARQKLRILETLLPQSTGIFLRRAGADMRAGVQGALEEMAASVHRLANDQELFHLVEELVASGRQDLAAQAIETATARGSFSAGILSACRCRVLATSGRLVEALKAVATEADPASPTLTSMRCRYLLLEQLLEFEAAEAIASRTALEWGEARDIAHVIDRMLYVFAFDRAETLLAAIRERHPPAAAVAAELAGQLAACRHEVERVTAEHGAAAWQDREAIFGSLSQAGTPPSRIVWGKLSLVALLQGDRVTEADYIRFAWFLPNWEQAAIRNRVLGAARRACPEAPAVQRGWLHYLVANGAYGDAAVQCESVLAGEADEDILFFVAALLRLQKDAIVPSFMGPALFEALRSGLLRRIAVCGAGFRCVMHDHFVSLGWQPAPWPEDAAPAHGDHEQRGMRRLLAVTPGRLNRIGTASGPAGAPKLRPVVAISGQLRGFEAAWPSLQAKLCLPAAAPLVMSVWDRSANAKGRHARRLERMLPDDVIARLKPDERYTDTFEAAYPRTAQLLFGQTEVHAQAVRALIDASGVAVIEVETESEATLEHLLHPNISANMLKMYYKFARLETLVREEEWRSGQVFSHVIWARPDCEIVQLAADDLMACLGRTDVAWSSFVTETTFGDYCMVLPRRAFAVLGGIFARVCLSADTRLLPWRPNRSVTPNERSSLDAFGGPDVFFDMLLAAGYMPISRIPRMVVALRGRTPGDDAVRAEIATDLQSLVGSGP